MWRHISLIGEGPQICSHTKWIPFNLFLEKHLLVNMNVLADDSEVSQYVKTVLMSVCVTIWVRGRKSITAAHNVSLEMLFSWRNVRLFFPNAPIYTEWLIFILWKLTLVRTCTLTSYDGRIFWLLFSFLKHSHDCGYYHINKIGYPRGEPRP